MLRILVLTFLLAALAWSPARAETTLCTEIASIPATISTQGVYCLKHDLTTAISSGAAITIATNNVIIDCNDFKIGGLGAGVSTNAFGIEALDKVNISIRHCGVRGFEVGIYLHGAAGGGQLIEDNRIDLSTATGVSVEGDDLVFRRNRILQTGGRPNIFTNSAVFLKGNGVVTDNFISGDAPTGSGGDAQPVGLNLSIGPYQAERNFVTGLVPMGTGIAAGIYGDTVPGNYRNNTVISSSLVTGYGINGGTAASACGENTVVKFSNDIANCTDAGGNISN